MDWLSEYEEKIDKFNSRVVDIHCRLVANINNLEELMNIQKELDKLTTEFYSFCLIWQDGTNDVAKQLEEMERKQRRKAPLLFLYSLIPFIGLILTIIFLINNRLYINVIKTAQQQLISKIEELTKDSNIIEDNLNNKYAFLNKKIAQFAGQKQPQKENEDYTFYFANEIINNYLDGYEIAFDTINPETQEAIRKILEKELRISNKDLEELLKLAKENYKPEILIRKKD